MHQPSRPARAAPRAAVWLLLASALLLSDSLLVEAAETLPSRFPPLALTFDTTIPDSAALLTPSFTDLTIDDPSLYILFDKAFPIAVEGDHPFVVGSRYGAGRVVALGNEAILTRCCAPDTKGVDQFVINALGWLAGDSPTLPIRLAILQGDPTRNNKLATMAQSVVTLTGNRFSYVGKLSDLSLQPGGPLPADVLIINAQYFTFSSAISAAAIQAFVRAGGGIIVAAMTSDYDDQATFYNYLLNHPANKITLPMGIFSTRHWFDGNAVWARKPTLPWVTCNGDVLLLVLNATFGGEFVGSAAYATNKTAVGSVFQSLRSFADLADWTSPYWDKLRSLSNIDPAVINTGFGEMPATNVGGDLHRTPVKNAGIVQASKEGLAVAARCLTYNKVPINELENLQAIAGIPPAAPEAAYFPGIPPSGTTPLASITATINGTTVGAYWQSTGTYALPGQVATVSLPSGVFVNQPAGIMVGQWTDELWDHDRWPRCPVLTRSFTAYSSAPVKVGTAFGGVIYVALPGGLQLGSIQVTITNAIRSIKYVHGVTTEAEWTAMKSYPAPWGVFSGRYFQIFSPKASLVAASVDPNATMTFWNTVQERIGWLGSFSPDSLPPDAITHDIDISAGMLHTGNPFMSFMDLKDVTLTPTPVNKWGHLHELGHMHHGNYRVPSYFGEVSNVFYAAYVYGSFEYGPTMLRPGGDYGWNYWSTRMARRENLLNESNGFRGNWEVLKEEPWLMLDSIVLLLESPPAAGGAPFGWTLLRDTMASYSSLTASQRAAAYASDQRKLEAFVRQLSTTAGYNFAPYFYSWGYPISTAFSTTLGSLKQWTANPYYTSAIIDSPPPPSPPPPRPPATMQPLAPPDLDLKYKIVVVFTLNGDRAAMESQLAAIRLQFAILLGINQEDIAISGVDGTGLRRLLAGTQVTVTIRTATAAAASSMGNTISAQKTQLVAALAAAGVSIDANSLVYTVQMADGAAVGPALSDNARNALIISVCTGVPLMAAVVGYAAYYARKRGHTCAPCATKVKVAPVPFGSAVPAVKPDSEAWPGAAPRPQGGVSEPKGASAGAVADVTVRPTIFKF